MTDDLDLTWSVTTQNLPEHARNPIHTDSGAQAAGFARALVAGVTTYAYLTHPVVMAWEQEWLKHGGAEIRFRRPVFDQDVLTCQVTAVDANLEIRAITSQPEQPRALLKAVRHTSPPSSLRPGEKLPMQEYVLHNEWGSSYGERCGDPLPIYQNLGLVHPAVWPAIANDIVHNHLARGSWVHTRSIISHFDTVPEGSSVQVESVVVRRFHSHGERAILDVHISVARKIVVSIEHEAIIDLRTY